MNNMPYSLLKTITLSSGECALVRVKAGLESAWICWHQSGDIERLSPDLGESLSKTLEWDRRCGKISGGTSYEAWVLPEKAFDTARLKLQTCLQSAVPKLTSWQRWLRLAF